MCRRRPHSNGLSVKSLVRPAAESCPMGWCDVIKSEHDVIRDNLEPGGVFYIA